MRTIIRTNRAHVMRTGNRNRFIDAGTPACCDGDEEDDAATIEDVDPLATSVCRGGSELLDGDDCELSESVRDALGGREVEGAPAAPGMIVVDVSSACAGNT